MSKIIDFFKDIGDDLFFLVMSNLPLDELVSFYNEINKASKIPNEFITKLLKQFENMFLSIKTLKIDNPSRTSLSFISEKMPFINNLSLINCKKILGCDFLPLKILVSIEKLEIVGSHKLMYNHVKCIISELKNLKYLKIRDCSMVSLDILKIKDLENVVELDLSNSSSISGRLKPAFNKHIHDDTLSIFFTNCKKLKVFKMENNEYVNDNWLKFIRDKTNIDFEFHTLGTKVNNKVKSCSSFRKKIEKNNQENTSGIIFVTSTI